MNNTKENYKRDYYDNEADANKQMSNVNVAASILAIVIWLLYLFKIFLIPDEFYPVVIILFPTISAVLAIPIFFVKNDKILRKPWYKFLILGSLLAAIIALNIAVPKHSLLFWPFAILIANHYYNPKVGRVVYFITIIAMVICMYLGMFFGEFDENLFGGGVIKSDGSIGTVETIQERLDLLEQKIAAGDNRYIKVLVFYYFPRAACVSLFFMVSNLLNKRTYKLLSDELRAHEEQEKSRTELNVAKDIQVNTLPNEYSSSKEVEIIGELKAAKEVGGDLYDYVDIDANHVAMLIGDVSGKGVPAAMFMMKTITSFRDFATANKTPSQILKEINTSIMKGNKAGMFVTCFLAIINKKNGKMIYSNAGHNPPIVGANHNFEFLKGSHGLLLGIFKNPPLKDEEYQLKTGDSLTLYTDGITEARNSEGDFFGEKRLLDTFNSKEFGSTLEFHHTLKEKIADFVKDAPQSDDITFVTLKYRGGRYSYIEKEFNGTKENIPAMLDFVSNFALEQNFPESFTNKLLIVGDELFSNIVKHGYEYKGGSIFLRLLFNEDLNEFYMTIIDKAKKFNQLTVDIPKDDKKPRIGGFGISIVKKIMDGYAYDYINGKNILLLKKKF